MVSFFDAISYGNNHKSTGQFLLEKVDGYFYLGGKKAEVIMGHTKGNSEGVNLRNVTSPSLLEIALKIASYCTIAIPALMLVAKIILRSIYKFHFISNPTQTPQNHAVNLRTSQVENISDHSPVELIQLFWEQHIRSFKISHGTTSLYHKHFKDHGISSSYPVALENTIAKFRAVWANHEHDITHRTGYFRDFERRYDQAREKQEVAVSFSAQASITQEYTTGARHGGEWVRELRHFLREASVKKNVLSLDEQRTLLETESLIDVMSSVPPMIVKINAGCPNLRNIFGWHSLFRPLDEFIDYIKLHCEGWQDPGTLSKYMNTILLPQLEDEKERHRTKYEITLHNVIHADHLEFEFVNVSRYRITPIPNDYPKLNFDRPQKLSSQEVGKLRIEHSGFSDIEEYQDSRFECEYSVEGNGTWTITRKALTEEDNKALTLTKEKREMRKYWMRIFGCEKLINVV